MPSRIDLHGTAVLVTRPAHQAGPLCDRIAAANGRPVRFPLLQILDNSDSPETRERLAHLGDYQIAIFISPNAIRFGLDAIEGTGGLPEPLQLAAVGQGTARALQQRLGRAPDLVPQDRFDSEGLLALPGLQQVAGKRILILRGNGGRELLAETLRERGAEVDYAEVYRREKPPADTAGADWLDKTDIISVTSSEALQNLVELTPASEHQRLFEKPLVVVSERTATLARKLGFTRALLAPRAGDDAIVDTIAQWAAQHN